MATITLAAAIAAAGCGSSKQGSDTAAVKDTAAVSSAADTTPAPGTAPNGPTTGAVVPSAKQTSTSAASAKRPATDTAKKAPEPDVRAPLPTSPAPGVRIPPGTGTPAFIVFRDSLTAADLDWVRSEGMEIVSSDKSGRSVSVMVPDGYHGNPRANPRVQRFTIAMR